MDRCTLQPLSLSRPSLHPSMLAISPSAEGQASRLDLLSLWATCQLFPRVLAQDPLRKYAHPTALEQKRSPGGSLWLLLLLSEQVQEGAVTPSETRPMERCSPPREAAAKLLLAVLALFRVLHPHLARGRHAASPPIYASTCLCCVQMRDVSVRHFGATSSVFSLPLNLSPDHTAERSGTCYTRHSI